MAHFVILAEDIEENTGISEETHRQCFHQYIGVGSTIIFQKDVVAPTNAAVAARHMYEMAIAGFPGWMSWINRCYPHSH